MERPLFVGVLWGAITGDMPTTVSLAVFYELFWLDLFPAGTYMPPNPLFPMLTTLTYAGTLHDPTITSLFLPVILTLPLASLGTYVEKRQREWQVTSYNRIVKKMRVNGELEKTAGVSVAASLLQLFASNFTVFSFVTGLLLVAVNALASQTNASMVFNHASWPMLWAIGAMGGVLALRIRRNYLVFIIGSVFAGLLALWGVWI